MPEPLNLFRLFEKSVKVSGFTLYAVSPLSNLMRRGIEESLKLMAQGKLKLLVGRKFSPVRSRRGASIHGVAPINRQACTKPVSGLVCSAMRWGRIGVLLRSFRRERPGSTDGQFVYFLISRDT
jgi:hypothetical protein